MEAVQTGRLTSSSGRLLLLEDLVEVGSQAAAHPVPQLAAEPPGDRWTRPQRRRRGGAVARLCLLSVVVDITCGVEERAQYV